METFGASVVVHESLTESPLLIEVRSAEIDAVGFVADGGGVYVDGGGSVGFLEQPATNNAKEQAEIRIER
jgi:hypothetical protein